MSSMFHGTCMECGGKGAVFGEYPDGGTCASCLSMATSRKVCPKRLRLSPAEKAVLKQMADLIGAFLALPDQHPSDAPDFIFHVHAIQNLMAFRVARRVDPGEWWQSK